jgi:hypothetical protein
MYYKFNVIGQFDGTSEIESDRTTTIAPPECIPDYNWNGYNWVYAPHVKPIEIVLGGGTSGPIIEESIPESESESTASE